MAAERHARETRARVDSRDAAAQLLAAARLGHLATIDSFGRPHVVPVCFARVGTRIYTPIDEKPKRNDLPRRVRNLLARPAVCLIVDRYDEDWAHLEWVQIRGEAALVDDASEREDALAALRARYPQYRAMALDERPLIRIQPVELLFWSAAAGTTRRIPLVDPPRD